MGASYADLRLFVNIGRRAQQAVAQAGLPRRKGRALPDRADAAGRARYQCSPSITASRRSGGAR